MAAPALRLTDLSFRYQEQGKRNILDHVSLDIPEGRVTVIMAAAAAARAPWPLWRRACTRKTEDTWSPVR